MSESIVGGLGVKGGYLGASIDVGASRPADINIDAEAVIQAGYFVSKRSAYSMFFNSTAFTYSPNNVDNGFTTNTVGAAIDACLARIKNAQEAAKAAQDAADAAYTYAVQVNDKLNDYAKASDLDNYATTEALSDYVQKGSSVSLARTDGVT